MSTPGVGGPYPPEGEQYPDHYAGQPMPAQYPPAQYPPGSGTPAFPEPVYTAPVGSGDPKLTVQAGRYWAGAAATALVAALIGLIGVVVFEQIFDQRLVPPPDLFSSGSHQVAYAVDGALLALVAAALLHVLILTAPRPRTFFGWIMALFTVVWAVLPFAWTSNTVSAVESGVVNLLIGIAIWSLLSGVAARTTLVAPARP